MPEHFRKILGKRSIFLTQKQLFDEGKAAMFGTGQWDCGEFDKNIGEHIGFWWGPKI